MKLLDVLTSPWAIEPSKLLEIQAIYATHLRGEKIDIAGVEQRLGRPLDNQPKGYDVVDGVAVLPISGVLAKRANLFMQVSGGTSTELAMRDLAQAVQDPAVHSIVLSIDSPGGSVDGVQRLADAVMAARGAKPVVAWASGAMASGAYWIGSAAQAAYIADSTTMVGSIGVVATHVDVSQAEAAQGIKTTEIVAGTYKRAASQYGPLSEQGRAVMQGQVDYLYSVFVGAVAKQRGVSEETVLKDMADGRVFIGGQAVTAGLVDGVSTLEDLIAKLNQDRAGAAQTPAPTNPPPKGQAMSLTREELQAQAPELVQAIQAEGASAERARIQAVESQLIPGHEALINTLKFDGKSSGGDAAMAVNAAERNLRQAHAQAQANAAPTPVPQAARATVEPAAPAVDNTTAEGIEAGAKAAWDKDAKLRAEFDNTFTTYLAFAKAQAGGQVKVLKSKE